MVPLGYVNCTWIFLSKRVPPFSKGRVSPRSRLAGRTHPRQMEREGRAGSVARGRRKCLAPVLAPRRPKGDPLLLTPTEGPGPGSQPAPSSRWAAPCRPGWRLECPHRRARLTVPLKLLSLGQVRSHLVTSNSCGLAHCPPGGDAPSLSPGRPATPRTGSPPKLARVLFVEPEDGQPPAT